MGKKAYLKIPLNNYEYDLDDQDDDDEHLIAFHDLIFEELLCNIKRVPFDRIINSELIYEDSVFYGFVESNSLTWLYTADRLIINNRRIYSFRFASPCHPDYYKSFMPYYHSDFEQISQTRHGLKGWYKYIGNDLPKMIRKFLKIDKVTKAKTIYEPTIFVNNCYERLDIEFDFQSDYGNERVTITF